MKNYTLADLLKMQQDTELKLDFKLEDLKPDVSLKEQGADSLDIASFLFEIEDYFGVSIEKEEMDDGSWDTINGILTKLSHNVKND